MLWILYGSQSGTAEEVALRIGRDAYLYGYDYAVCSMDELEAGAASAIRLAIFVCSTTGEGEEPDNMKLFWRFLRRKDLPLDLLKEMHFAVFGLGDSSYELYNFAAKKLYRRLIQLGAAPIIERGDGDDQHRFGPDGGLVPWLDLLWPAMGPIAVQGGCCLVPKAELQPAASLQAIGSLDQAGSLHAIASADQAASPHAGGAVNATLVQNERISGAHADVKDVRHLVFETALPYEPGDVAVLRPRNSSEGVDEILAALRWPDQVFRVAKGRPDFRPPFDTAASISLRELLEKHLDINRPPTRYFFTLLSQHVDPAHPLHLEHRSKLLELGSNTEEGLDAYMGYVWRPRRRPAEVIGDFPSLGPLPVDLVFDLLPWIKPRSFSIASYSPGSRVELATALVRYKTVMHKERVGLFSQWCATLAVGTRLQMSISRGSMRLPANTAAPLILCCSGTGIAPMRSFIQKVAQYDRRPPVCLFFGCRRIEHDALFIESLQKLPFLQVFCRGSRDSAPGVPKMYLQDMILQQSELVASILMDPTSTVYLSGNSKLPAGVKKALSSVMATRGLDGDAFVAMLASSKRFHSETWS